MENYQFNIHIMFDEGKIFILSALLSIDQFPKANLDLFEIWKEGSPVLGFEPWTSSLEGEHAIH